MSVPEDTPPAPAPADRPSPDTAAAEPARPHEAPVPAAPGAAPSGDGVPRKRRRRRRRKGPRPPGLGPASTDGASVAGAEPGMAAAPGDADGEAAARPRLTLPAGASGAVTVGGSNMAQSPEFLAIWKGYVLEMMNTLDGIFPAGGSSDWIG
ncbi:MAG: hypothetical protein HY060_10245, partial [Proteobacteria bacterium]|nr:hypothetical protein [Pseudomonadota bacterium]